jgi:hypothetical protein
MSDPVKAAHALESAILLICDANNHIDPEDIKRISRLRFIIRQLGHEAEELRLSTRKVIEGGKGE